VAETGALLRQGALLAIDGMELLHEPVAELCAAIEAAVQTPVAAELYACWVEGAPRAPQWDNHETLLLQIDGKKEWQLFEPTASHPIAGSPAPPPLGDARWKGTLAPGDLLYIPRGWWYQDKALAEPALCLALTFQNLKAIDMIARLLLQAQGRHLLRRDVPWFQGAEAQSRFLTSVQQGSGISGKRAWLSK
jgi:ribosomal protein L16 Arg81 hydroxylase